MSNPFEYRQMSDEQIKASNELRVAALVFHNLLQKDCPQGRYKSLALTSLEECLLWANKSICFDDK